jgi:ABC-type uncharacterized transport system ATPase subunit
MLARRPVRSLSLAERRSVMLALALTSKAEVILVEEPLVAIDPVLPRLVVDALHARGTESSIVVTTASPRDALRLANRIGVLTRGTFAPLDAALGNPKSGPEKGASMRVVVSAAHGRDGAALLASSLGASEVVKQLEVTTYASGASAISITGSDPALLGRAVTHSIATTGIDVDLVEPSTLSLDAVRAALAARGES